MLTQLCTQFGIEKPMYWLLHYCTTVCSFTAAAQFILLVQLMGVNCSNLLKAVELASLRAVETLVGTPLTTKIQYGIKKMFISLEKKYFQ